MSKTPNYDKKVQEILAATKPGERTCALTGQKWTMTDEEIGWYRRLNVPPLRIAPKTFLKQISLFLTGFSWWWNKDALTGKPLITSTHPHTPYHVIPDKEWHARDFSTVQGVADPTRPFFDQFCELMFRVPVSAWKNFQEPVNSIARHSFGDRDSHFVEGTSSRNAFYSSDSLQIEDCEEVCWSSHVQDSYNVMLCQGLSQCRVARHSSECRRCDFVFDCHDCEFVFFSWNQRHKRYVFRNEQLTKEAWEQKMAALDLTDSRVFEDLYRAFKEAVGQEAVWPEHFNERCQNSTGDHLQNCVNVRDGWYCDGAKDSWQILWGNLGTERCALGCDPGSSEEFGNMISVNGSGCKFSWVLTRCRDVEYSYECLDCESCFGCVGLKHKRFHLFNKPYEEQEYWRRVDEFKCAMLERGEYGTPFPTRLMQTHANEAGGRILYYYTETDLAAIGVETYDPSEQGAYGDWTGKTFKTPADLPARLEEVHEEWLSVGILDPSLHRPFSIHPGELALHKRLGVALRREHFIKRVLDLWKEVNMKETMQAVCGHCQTSLTIAENQTYRHRKIYCRPCYLKYLEERS